MDYKALIFLLELAVSFEIYAWSGRVQFDQLIVDCMFNMLSEMLKLKLGMQSGFFPPTLTKLGDCMLNGLEKLNFERCYGALFSIWYNESEREWQWGIACAHFGFHIV